MKKRALVSRTRIASYVFIAGLGLGATRAVAQDVDFDYDKAADFSKCTTYAWAKGQPAQNPFAHKNIVEAVDRALSSKGWKKVNVEDGPGCYVMYQASVKAQKGLQVWGSGGRFLGGTASVDVKTVVDGMLVVDIGVAATRELIWRGVAKDTLSDKSEKNEKKLAKCMDKMFKDFPPEPTAR